MIIVLKLVNSVECSVEDCEEETSLVLIYNHNQQETGHPVCENCVDQFPLLRYLIEDSPTWEEASGKGPQEIVSSD